MIVAKRSSAKAVKFLLDGSLALSEIEANGVRVDMKYVERTSAKIRRKIERMETKLKGKNKVWRLWQKEFGKKANLGSREQLGKVLFTRMGYKPAAYTAGSYDEEGVLGDDARGKTDKASLDHIPLPFVKRFLKVENLKKTLGTYLDGLKAECVKHKDGHSYVHPIINLNTAASFRSSEQLPNLQNQPKRDQEMANFVRRAFLPHPGEHIVDFDFSTLEVRIAYCYHKDPKMKKYLTDDSTDMHGDTAVDLFMIPPELYAKHKKDFKPTLRDSAKNQFVFPEFYGSVYFQCAKNIWEAMERKKWKMPNGITVKKHLRRKGIKRLGNLDPKAAEDNGPDTFVGHIQKVEKKLWKRFHVYDRWKKTYYQEYLDKGYLEMLTGFVVWAPHKKNDVINYGTQGSAFHCLLWCLIKMTKWLKKKKLKSKIIGEIHDSASMSIPPNELQRVITKMHRLMTVELPKAWKWITIPMKAEVEVAPVNRPWNEQVEWTKKEDGTWSAKV